MSNQTSGGGQRRDSFQAALQVPDVRALLAAGWVSAVGDQCARVAITVLIYQRTGSAGWAALGYALTFVPDLVGGPLLAGLADRFPRRRVAITADLLRAVLIAGMALPGMPLVVMCGLLVLVQLAGSPGGAARAAMLAQVLPGDRLVTGQAAWSIMVQFAQVLGFAGGGAVVAGVGVSGALLLDAATFVISAAVISRWVRPSPTPRRSETGSPSDSVGEGWWRQLAAGAGLVWSDRLLRALVAAACVSGFYIAGEALAVPYAAELGGGPLAAGLLIAAYPLGTVLGMLALVRLPHRVQVRLLPVLVIAACAPLLLCVLRPGLITVGLLFVASGAASAYNAVASALFLRAVPDARRGQAFGLAATALRVSQGLGVLLAGLAAERFTAGFVLTAAGLLGVVAAAWVAMMWRRTGAPAAASERQQPADTPDSEDSRPGRPEPRIVDQ